MTYLARRGRRRRQPLRLYAATAVLAAVGMLAATTPPQTAPSVADAAPVAYRLDPELGVQFHGMWAYYTDDQRNYVLGQLQQANIHAVRMDVSWAMLQPSNGASYDPWGVAFVDRVIAMINAHGITPLITLWLTPGWANGNRGERVLPNNMADFTRVAEWAARRYAGKVGAWEIWNEPNSAAFLIPPDPVGYVRLLQAGYVGFKRGNPTAPVVFGGLEYNDDAWLTRAYNAGAKGFFDVMSTHSYQGMANESPLAPDDGSIYKFMHLPAIRAVMVARGDGHKSIWTGMGYSTHVDPPNTPPWNRGVSETTQAIYLYQAVNHIRQNWPWVGKFGAYVANDEDVPNNFHERHYGLMRADLSPKPSLVALRDLANAVPL